MYNMIGITWKNFVDDDIVKNYDVITFIVKYLYFKKDWSCQFCWHHQNCNSGYQKISKNSKKSKQLPKMLSVFVFSDVAKFANFLWKNSHVNRTQRVCRCPPPPLHHPTAARKGPFWTGLRKTGSIWLFPAVFCSYVCSISWKLD